MTPPSLQDNERMSPMMQSLPTAELYEAGQSPWLDFISREILNSGELRELIEEKGLKGVTSNPSIFEKAFAKPGGGYDQDIQKMAAKGLSAFKIYDAISISDIQRACDLFLPVFEETRGGHGFVSLEVEPGLSYKTEETVREARRLFKAVARPNVMIKIPATPEGIPAIEACIGEGINVNVTLIFSLPQYKEVAFAYLRGLKKLKQKKGDLRKVFSVASVFVSRIDTLVDKKLESIAAGDAEILGLRGKAAIANSKLIYQEYLRIFETAEFESLQTHGAQVQKVLWGSTSSKNPAYSDLVYVDPLVGRNTVNTMPQNTLEALLDHGRVRPDSVEREVEEARRTIFKLKNLGIDLDEAGEKLQKDGVKLFADAFDSLIGTLELKKMQFSKSGKNFGAFSYHVSPEIEQAFLQKAAQLQKTDFLARFLKKDASLWKSDAAHQAVINNRLGWLRAHEWACGKLHELDGFAAEIKKAGFTDVVLLGMGGSSLAPEVMDLIAKPKTAAGPNFYMLDTTDPGAILKVEKKIRLKTSLFIVASKSGGTVETVSQFNYFYERVCRLYKDPVEAGAQFISITDSGSSLEKNSREKNFRKIFINPSDIGGRYSALSYFGLVPAALGGIPIRALLKAALDLFTAFSNERELAKNPAAAPGILMAVLAQKGMDKLTLAGDDKLASFGAWLEQLIAESTGKEGKGVIPVDSEIPGAPEEYGKDRAFLFFDAKPSVQAQALKKAGFPVLRIEWPAPSALGAEFLRWEIATVVAGMVLGINPFDEPNVKEAKDATGVVLEKLRKTGSLNAKAAAVASIKLGDFVKKAGKSGYIVLLPFTERSAAVQKAFDASRKALRRLTGCPVLLGFGPRYLHSIGQLYKGGPRKGIFIEFFVKDAKDMKVPGAFYTFGQLKTAQALGDKAAMESKPLPVLTVDLGTGLLSGIKAFEQKVLSLGNKSGKK